MSKYLNRLTTKRQFSAVLGVTKEEFEKLLPAFSIFLQKKAEDDYQKSLPTRKREPSPGNPEMLTTHLDKLVFILYYLKNYPSYDTMGFNFETCAELVEVWVNPRQNLMSRYFYLYFDRLSTGFKKR